MNPALQGLLRKIQLLQVRISIAETPAVSQWMTMQEKEIQALEASLLLAPEGKDPEPISPYKQGLIQGQLKVFRKLRTSADSLRRELARAEQEVQRIQEGLQRTSLVAEDVPKGAPRRAMKPSPREKP